MKLIKTISASISSAITYVKYLRMGKDDVQETPQVAPFGIDSAPIAGMVGLYAETDVKGENVLIGYVFKNAVALPGEIKIFSTDSSGTQKAYIHAKNNGDIHLNGDDDNLVRFTPLNATTEEIVDKLNELIGNWNTWCTTYVPGSPVFTGLPATAVSLQVTPSTASMADAKIDALKCSQSD